MKKVALIILICIFAIQIETKQSKTKPAAIIKTIIGKLEVKPVNPAKWMIAKVGMQLFVGDELRTGDFGKATIMFIDGTELKLNTNSQIVIKRIDRKKRGRKEKPAGSLKMNQGDIWGKVTPQEGREFTIETPTAIAAVKGTELGLKVEKKDKYKTTLFVYSGIVELSNEMGKALAKASEMSVAEENEAPTEPVKVDTNTTQEWTDDMTAKANLKVQFNPVVPAEAPFNIAITANDNTGKIDVNRKDVVTLTSSSKTMLFSKDKKKWASTLQIALTGGFASCFGKDTKVGSASISVTANDVSPSINNINIAPSTKATSKDLIIKIRTEEGEKIIILKYRR